MIFRHFGKLVDVGGGNGSLLIGILKANPHLHGIVFDLPHAAEKARAKIAEAGLQSRCEAIAGDFFKEVPAGADAYIIKHVIHDWNDERATAILRSIHRAMPPHGKLLIAEGVYPARVDQSDSARGAAANDVNMLVCTGGRQRSEAEFRSLLRSRGVQAYEDCSDARAAEYHRRRASLRTFRWRIHECMTIRIRAEAAARGLPRAARGIRKRGVGRVHLSRHRRQHVRDDRQQSSWQRARRGMGEGAADGAGDSRQLGCESAFSFRPTWGPKDGSACASTTKSIGMRSRGF